MFLNLNGTWSSAQSLSRCWHRYEPGVAGALWNHRTETWTNGSLRLVAYKLTSRNRSVDLNLIQRTSVDLSTGDRNVGRQRLRRQTGRGGPHTGRAGKLTNSTVNGSTADKPLETHNAGLACRGYPGNQGVRRSRPGQKDKNWTSVGK